MLALRSSLSLLAAAIVLAVVAGPAWGWGIEAQRTVPGVTNADRLVVDTDGTIYLLDQFGEASAGAGGRFSAQARLVRVAADLSTATPLAATSGVGLGTWAVGVTGIYSTSDFAPSGMAIDRGLRRVYVSTGDAVQRFDLTAGTWSPFVAEGSAAADWYAGGRLPGAIAVDQTTHHVYVADFGANLRCFFTIGRDCDEPEPFGPVRVREFDSSGALLRTLPVPAGCSDGTDPASCPLGSFAIEPGVPFQATGPTALDTTADAGGTRLAAIHSARLGSGDDRVTLSLIDRASGAVGDRLATGVGTRPLGFGHAATSREDQSLEFGSMADGTFVVPEVTGAGASGLMQVDPTDDRVVSRFAARGSGTCALQSGSVRLATDAARERLVVAEQGPGVRITVLRPTATGCSERAVVARQPTIPRLFFARVSAFAAGGDGRDYALTDGATVALPVPRSPGGAILSGPNDYAITLPEALTDPDNGLENLADWATCSLAVDGVGELTRNFQTDNCGVNASIALPPLSFVRPAEARLTLVDDDDDVTRWSVRVVADEPLKAAFTADAVESGRLVFDLDKRCEAESCPQEEDLTQLSTGPIDTWELDPGDGTPARTGDWRDIDELVEHEYTANGTFTARLTLRAAGRDDATATRTVTVDRGDTSVPEPGLEVTPAGAVLGTAMTFTPSDAGTGTLASWTLDYGDGDRRTGTVADFGPVSHTYRAVGTYTPRLTIELTNGRSASVSRTVSLTARPRDTVPEQSVVKSCITPFGVQISILGLGDERLCTADPCDLDVAELGLTGLGFVRPASCDAAGTATDLGASGEAEERPGARPRLGAGRAIERLTMQADGRIAVRLRCTAGAGSCGGELVVDLRPASGGTRRLGTVTFSKLRVGRTRTVRLRPSVKRRRELAREDRRQRSLGRRARIRLRLRPADPPSGILRPRSETLTVPVRVSRVRR